jgi:hypothetical protein
MQWLDMETRRLERFRRWLVQNGASVLTPKNDSEVLRFEAGEETGIVYRKDTGQLTFTGCARAAWKAYRAAKPWSGCARPQRIRKLSKIVIVRSLLRRDGDLCFYCRRPLEDDYSVEHLVPATHGGPNHVSNLVLAHKRCNLDAGHLSAMEKIWKREAAARASLTPDN